MMDEKELAARVKALNKAISSQEPSTTIISMLEALRKDASPTEEVLRSTKAGLVVGKLRSNANKDIGRIASEVVNKWKRHVDAAKEVKKARMMGSSSAAGTPKSTASPMATPSSNTPSSTAKQPYEGDPEQRHFKKDKVNINRTTDVTRNNIIGVLYNGLAYRRTESIEEIVSMACRLEAAADKAYKGTTEAYRKRMRALFAALKRKDNAQLGQRVLSGEISPAEFVVMTDDELASPEQKAKDALLEKENMLKAQVAVPEKSISDAFTCSKCGQNKVSYTQAQTRSADEPMTTFCECTFCGNRWKFS